MARSSAVGAGLGAALTALAAALSEWTLDELLPCGRQEWDCLGSALLLLGAATVFGFLASWLLLRLAGVRPAWRVAVLAGLLVWFGAELSDRALAGSLPTAVSPLASAALFALAAALTAPRPLLWQPRIALLVALALLWPLSGLVGDHRTEASKRSELVDAGVPLLAPDVTGYRLDHPWATRYGHELVYRLWPERPGVDANDPNGWAVHVSVAPMEPGFHPPVCEAHGDSGPFYHMPCKPVAPNTWRTVKQHSVFYFVRRDDAVAVLASYGTHVTDGELRALASTVTVREPGFFLR
ncbi:hypothetical protein ACIHCX_08795 [Streptomyces sp. NPDC052043]|uniref:hypothetical protein n=1 Tax=Streptomyces sp. NPDC052043 TaxID=3365684 RepID=UPI0037D784BB